MLWEVLRSDGRVGSDGGIAKMHKVTATGQVPIGMRSGTTDSNKSTATEDLFVAAGVMLQDADSIQKRGTSKNREGRETIGRTSG